MEHMKIIYFLVEHVIVDGMQHNLYQSLCFTKLETALRVKATRTEETGHTFSMCTSQLVEY